MVELLERDEIATKINKLDEEYNKALDVKDIEKAGNLTIESIAESFRQAKGIISDIEGFFEGENPANLPPNDLMLIHLEDAIPVMHWAYCSLLKFGMFRSRTGGNLELNIQKPLSTEDLQHYVVSTIEAEGLDSGIEKQIENIIESTVIIDNLLDQFVDEFRKIAGTESMIKIDKLLEEVSLTMPECMMTLQAAYLFFELGPSIATGMSEYE